MREEFKFRVRSAWTGERVLEIVLQCLFFDYSDALLYAQEAVESLAEGMKEKYQSGFEGGLYEVTEEGEQLIANVKLTETELSVVKVGEEGNV